MGDLSHFQRGRIFAARSAGASVTKTSSLLGVSRAAVSSVMTAYTNHVDTSSAKRNSSRKPKLSEKDCRTLKSIVSKNHRTAAANVTAELIIHLEDPVPQKQSNEIFTNPTSTVQLQLPNI
jgi:predicted transcriptional regulator